MGHVVYIKTYIFNHLYSQFLVLLTIVPRNSKWVLSMLDSYPKLRGCLGFISSIGFRVISQCFIGLLR